MQQREGFSHDEYEEEGEPFRHDRSFMERETAERDAVCLRTIMRHTQAVQVSRDRRRTIPENDQAGEMQELNAVPVVELHPDGLQCNNCEQPATVLRQGDKTIGMDVPDCPSSGGCEVSWVSQHPKDYLTKGDRDETTLSVTGTACGNCAVRLTLELQDGKVTPQKVWGTCRIDSAGRDYQKFGRNMLNSMRVVDPDAGIEQFDGADSERDEPQIADPAVSETDNSCTGSQLTNSVAKGVLPPPSSYECPRSVQSGEHCLQILEATDTGEILAVDGGDWRTSCLLRQTTEDQR